MKAAVISAPGAVSVETLPDPSPGPADVVVAPAACGVCGTDLHILRGEFAPTLPVTPGHEFGGTVIAVGAEASGVAVGDAVAVDPSLPCRACPQCRRGRENLCENWAAIGVTRAGAAAEQVVVPARNCYRLPAGIDPADAALVEPLSCAVRGVDVLPRRLGDRFLIYGAGTMGLMMLQLVKRAGAATVSVVDPNAGRLETARTLGCTQAAGAADELAQASGFDVVVDCTGVAAAIQDGLGRVGKGGTFLQFGVADYAARATIEPYKIYNQEITITGSMAVLDSYDRALDLFLLGVVDPAIFVSHRIPLADYRGALDLMTAGTGRKIQVVP